MAKKMLMLCVLLCSFLSMNAQVKESLILVEPIDSIGRLGSTRHFIAYCASGKLPVTDVLFYDRIRGHEQDYRVVSVVIDKEICQRTLCLFKKINVADLVVKGVTSKENTQVVVNFTDGSSWETSDLSWLEALPGQKVHRTFVDGETYTFNRCISDGEVDQEVYYSVMAQN
ncbi:MAG: hypothetical protein J6Y91_02885 [Alphaproteobacteria bacterium]|nr:hypothetical protein [Alphaproteobacteria bacterium]